MDIENLLNCNIVSAECRAKEKVCQVVKMTGISAHAEIYSFPNEFTVFAH